MKEEENKRGLNPKEIVFCRLRAEGKTPSQAAEAAGYTSKGYGDVLMKKEKIRKAILDFSEGTKNLTFSVAENEEILQFLTSIMRGEEYEEKKDSVIKDRMRAAELLGKRLRLFETGSETGSQVVIIDDLALEKEESV